MDALAIAVSHSCLHKSSKYMVEEEIEFRIWARSRTLNTQMVYGVSKWGTQYAMTG